MHQAIELLLDGANDVRMAMAGVEDADAAGEIEIFLSVGVPDAGSFGPVDENGMRVREAARDMTLSRAD